MAVKFNLAKTYNKTNIFDTLDSLNIKQGQGNVVETIFNNKIISTSEVSDRYQIFDFSTFAKDMVEQVENYFDPEQYILRIRKGEQELRLIGEEFLINEEPYYKMFNLLNSTDKSKALQINIGLMRLACKSGIVLGKEGSFSHMKVKHYKSKLGGQVQEFGKNIEKFDVSIDYQSSLIKELANKQVSYFDLAKRFVFNKEGEIENSKILKLKAFGKKLQNSKTDRLYNLSTEQINLLNNPDNYLINDNINVDVIMTGIQAFNCYIELWKNYDSSIMYRESNRFIDLIY